MGFNTHIFNKGKNIKYKAGNMHQSDTKMFNISFPLQHETR